MQGGGGRRDQAFEDLMQEEPRIHNEGVASDRPQGILYETEPRNGYLRARGLQGHQDTQCGWSKGL